MKYIAKLSLLALVLLTASACQKESADPDASSFYLSDFRDAFNPTSDTWIINSTDGSTGDFEGLRVSLVAATEAGRVISLVFPNLVEFPFNALYEALEGDVNEVQCIVSVSAPMATTIGRAAFRHCAILSEISFPEATVIEDYAFQECTSLTDISGLFSGVTEIGHWAFYGCTALSDLSFPEATYIGAQAFQSCTSLTDISTAFPLVDTVGNYAFRWCTGLPSASFPSLTALMGSAFYGCDQMREIELSTNGEAVLDEIGLYVFMQDDGSTIEGDITLTIGELSSVSVFDNRLRVGTQSYYFQEIVVVPME